MVKRKLTDEEKAEKENDRIIIKIQNIVIGKYAYGYNVYTLIKSEKTGEETARNIKYPANFTEALKLMYDRLLQKKLNERPVEDLENIEKLISLIKSHDKWFEELSDKIIENGGIVE